MASLQKEIDKIVNHRNLDTDHLTQDRFAPQALKEMSALGSAARFGPALMWFCSDVFFVFALSLRCLRVRPAHVAGAIGGAVTDAWFCWGSNDLWMSSTQNLCCIDQALSLRCLGLSAWGASSSTPSVCSRATRSSPTSFSKPRRTILGPTCCDSQLLGGLSYLGALSCLALPGAGQRPFALTEQWQTGSDLVVTFPPSRHHITFPLDDSCLLLPGLLPVRGPAPCHP
eukprot:872941-Rhodomonas_salina.1